MASLRISAVRFNHNRRLVKYGLFSIPVAPEGRVAYTSRIRRNKTLVAQLIPVEILSIYFAHHNRVNLPDHMAKCAPDMKKAMLGVREDLQAKGVDLFISDCSGAMTCSFRLTMKTPR